MWKSSSSRSIAKSSHAAGSIGKSMRRSSFYSTSADDYKLLEEVGNGATATVYRAIFSPTNEVVAVKCLNLDRCNANLDDIRREAQTMSLIDHPNLISAYCSFVVEHSLWVVMPFMTEGSCLHLMKIAYPDGFEESVIGPILKETLKAMEYLHRHGHIHRDIKAGNILLDSSGLVKLGDFGVSACVFDNGDRQRSRNTFVGTPCWMAPEVLQPGNGYDFKADIWSFGITALELAHGHAPFSKYPPMKVLLMTLQNAPPGLDYERDKRFSKSFKEMVAMCLVKDQRKRPTAEKLLKHSFFKNVKPPELSVKSLLSGLPPLWDRVKELQFKDNEQLAMKQEALSMSEYQRGVSAWKFDIEDLKAQASLIVEDEELTETKENGGSLNVSISMKHPSSSISGPGKPTATDDNNLRDNIHAAEGSRIKLPIKVDELADRVLPDGCENAQKKNDLVPSTSKQGMDNNNWKVQLEKKHPTYSGPNFQSGVRSNSFSERAYTSGRFDCDNQPATDKSKRDLLLDQNLSGPLMLPNRASANSLSAPMRSGGPGESLDERSKFNMVQIKGRFSVTSENVDIVKDILLSPVPKRSSEPPIMLSKESTNSSIPASILTPHLQNLLQQTSFQQDLIMNILTSLQQNELGMTTGSGAPTENRAAENNKAEIATAEREQLLRRKIAQLQAGIASLTDELTTERLKHYQLQEQLDAIDRHKESA